ncbi:lysophospholipid acyltransferase family protein [Photobacterium rosenbergii]|uniref:lysophospholipid acyltransferase family protein n=1 Tax=Photobacterium rosenbergii TaxID=294936 RepID=UPI0021BD0D23|nr:lysophospholipid acyltransferase family protein [Photobacterium rosenbergii]
MLGSLLKRINKLWRIAATGLCFSIFGLGALCLTFVVFPLVTWSVKDQVARELKVQKVIQQSFDLFSRLMRFSGALDYQIVGAETLRQDENCIVVANHPSLIDYVLIGSCLPQCDCIVKAAIWQNPFMKGIVKAAGYIPNINPESLLDACNARLSSGNVLLIFPEGTRTTPGIDSSLQRGAAQIAVRSEADIRLVHITVEPSFLTKQSKWYQVPDKKPYFHVEVQQKINIDQFVRDGSSPTTAARQLNRHLADVLFPN